MLLLYTNTTQHNITHTQEQIERETTLNRTFQKTVLSYINACSNKWSTCFIFMTLELVSTLWPHVCKMVHSCSLPLLCAIQNLRSSLLTLKSEIFVCWLFVLMEAVTSILPPNLLHWMKHETPAVCNLFEIWNSFEIHVKFEIMWNLFEIIWNLFEIWNYVKFIWNLLHRMKQSPAVWKKRFILFQEATNCLRCFVC